MINNFNNPNLRLLLFISIIVIIFADISAQGESYYIKKLNDQYFKGETEVKVPNGRADIVNDGYAIEVEWADKWKNSIGQALWYGLQSNKKPGIVLIMKDINDRKYGIMLMSALDYAGMTDQIKVWFYPEDFGGSFESVNIEKQELIQTPIETNGSHTRNTNSGVRHKVSCAYADCTNCVPCGATEGSKACGRCGG